MKTPDHVTDIKVGRKKQNPVFSEDLKQNIRSTIERIRYFGVSWGAGDYVDVEDLENICDYAEDMIGLIEDMKSRLAQVERERDALAYEARGCSSCVHRNCDPDEPPCNVCVQDGSEYEWRGPCPENTKENET